MRFPKPFKNESDFLDKVNTFFGSLKTFFFKILSQKKKDRRVFTFLMF